MAFLSGNPKLEWLEDSTAVLIEDIVYQDGDVEYRIPAGYVTDGASVPRVITWWIPKMGTYFLASTLHDWLITDLLPTGQIDSITVDRLFRESMVSIPNIPKVRAWSMWVGVRWGAMFNKKRRKGSLKTFPGVLLGSVLLLPVVLTPAVTIGMRLGIFWLVSQLLPKSERITAHKS